MWIEIYKEKKLLDLNNGSTIELDQNWLNFEISIARVSEAEEYKTNDEALARYNELKRMLIGEKEDKKDEDVLTDGYCSKCHARGFVKKVGKRPGYYLCGFCLEKLNKIITGEVMEDE